MFLAAQGTGAHPKARALTCLRLSTGRQRRGLPCALGRFDQKCGDRDGKNVRERLQRINGYVLGASLNSTDIRTINLCRQRQSLLR